VYFSCEQPPKTKESVEEVAGAVRTVIVRREIRVVIINILDMFLISLFLERRDQKERAGSSDL
jgi:hypothetical protein